MTNPLIEKARAALLAKINPRLKPVVDKVVASGRKVMYSDHTRAMAIEELKRGQDPESVGSAVAKLSAVLMNQSKSTIPMQVLLPATMMLLFEVLDFLEEAGRVQVDGPQLAAYTQATGSAFLQMLGVTPEKLQGMIGKAQANQSAQPAPGSPAAPAMPQPTPAPMGIVGGAA